MKQKRQHRPTRATTAASAPAPASASSQVRLKAAHAKFMQIKEGEGTPAYDRAWEELLDALFVNAK